jgi:phage gpG-like protein
LALSIKTDEADALARRLARLTGEEVDRAEAVAPRPNLRIHTVGKRGDLIDDGGHLRDGYGVAAGDWVLVRPDGYIGAIVSSGESAAFTHYLARVGLAL